MERRSSDTSIRSRTAVNPNSPFRTISWSSQRFGRNLGCFFASRKAIGGVDEPSIQRSVRISLRSGRVPPICRWKRKTYFHVGSARLRTRSRSRWLWGSSLLTSRIVGPPSSHICYGSARPRGGLPSITSSVIEHHPHQLRIARRVLQDPVQRYLLADEVGLGKTIEAGIILRQLLIDDANTKAIVLAPRFLIPQWQRELAEKFLLGDFPEDAVAFVPHEEPKEWVMNREPPDILIVDEAQHLAAMWRHTEPTMAARYSRLVDLAHRVERLLLLSATPVLHREAAFLAMLHLLDPEIHDLEDLDGFRARVAKRTEVGELFFTFREDTPAFLLGNKINRLRELFPSDARLSGFLDQLSESLKGGQDLTGPIRRIRTHLSESYRLHRRMLRTRRPTAAESYQVAGRSDPHLVFGDDPAVQRLEQLVDDWRSALVGAFGD